MGKKRGKKRIKLTNAEVHELNALLKEKLPPGEVDGWEAAFDDLLDEELCRDLASSFARESARKTGDAIGDVRDRYDTIVIEFLAARYTQTDGKPYSLGTVLRCKYETDTALREFLPKLAKLIREYVSDCIHEHNVGFTPLYQQIIPTHTWTLCGCSVRKELLTALAEEYVRDRGGLLSFLCAVFKCWRKIDQPHSAWRVKLVIEQHANDVPHHRIAQRLEKIDAVPKGTDVPGTSSYRKLRSTIKQIRSRDRKKAIENRISMELRTAGETGLYKAEISERTDFRTAAVSDALVNLHRSGKAKWRWRMADTTQPGKVKRIRQWFMIKRPGDENG